MCLVCIIMFVHVQPIYIYHVHVQSSGSWLIAKLVVDGTEPLMHIVCSYNILQYLNIHGQ